MSLDIDTREFVPDNSASSITKALAVLAAFDGPETDRALQEITLRTGLPKSTTHRLLHILIQNDMVERRGRNYVLSNRMFELGNLVPACRPRQVREVAKPYLCELYRATRLTVNLAVLAGCDVLYLDRLTHPAHRALPVPVGGRIPAHCTALGKVLLAYDTSVRLPTAPLAARTDRTIVSPDQLMAEFDCVRQRGWAADAQEAAPGVICVAVPITEPGRDAAIAAISVTAPDIHHPIARHIPQLRQAAADVARHLRRG